MSGEKTMRNDGTGLRDAELDALTIYDIACIRADASNATREDVEFKAIALRNYKAITALSAVAPPPAFKWPSEAKRVGADWEARTTLTHHSMSEAQANVWNACRAACIASARFAAPAAPAQPEGGDAVACEIEAVGDRYGTYLTHASAMLRTYNGYAPARGDKLYTRPAPEPPPKRLSKEQAKERLAAISLDGPYVEMDYSGGALVIEGVVTIAELTELLEIASAVDAQEGA